MNIIKHHINYNLKNKLKELVKEINFNELNKKINYVNIYHSSWSNKINNKNINFINLVTDEIGPLEFNNQYILRAGFLNSVPKCDNQFFHIDYSGRTETYFIPLTDLTNNNGTEYLSFKNKDNYKKYYNLLLSLSNKYLNKEDICEQLEKNNIKRDEYDFIIYNCNAYSLYKLPNYVLHRGKTNETNEIRTIFQLVTSNNINDAKLILLKETVNDAELDELDIVNSVINRRINSNK